MRPPPALARARAVRRGLDRYARRDPGPLSQGLSPENARRCLALALEPLTVEAICDAASEEPGRRRPTSVAVVVAQGVYTSPIEWAAVYLAAGCAVHLKAPSADPAACLALAADLAAEGLPVTASPGRELSGHEAIVVFGDDDTGAAVAAAWPAARVVAFGHRVSAALVDVPADPGPLADALALDCALYDTRGCMAPVAVLARGDAAALAGALAAALAALDAALPPGPLDPALGPERRRRLALARVHGSLHAGARWAVPLVPADQVVPAALPRVLPVVPAPAALDGPALALLRAVPLSSLAVEGAPDLHRAAAALAPRVVAPGQLQRPRIPRRHDGLGMLSCVLDPPPPRPAG